MKKIVALLLVFLVTFFSCACSTQQEMDSLIEDNKFQLIIEADKTKVKIGETINLKCCFINKTDKKQELLILYDVEKGESKIFNIDPISDPIIDNYGDLYLPIGIGQPAREMTITLLPETEWCCYFPVKTSMIKGNEKKILGYSITEKGDYKIAISYYINFEEIRENDVLILQKEILRSNEIYVNVTK